MAEEEKKIQIITNESNHIIEIEAGETTQTTAPNTTADKAKAAEQFDQKLSSAVAEGNINEIATNDGSIIETLDTDFHGKPGVSKGENLSGSDRADYYEARSQGKSDAEEELDMLNDE
jgi:hypothetical protein